MSPATLLAHCILVEQIKRAFLQGLSISSVHESIYQVVSYHPMSYGYEAH